MNSVPSNFPKDAIMLDSPSELPSAMDELGKHTTDPDRPFTGQSHTDQGKRGMTEVQRIRFRDLSDCLARALVSSDAPLEHELGTELRKKRDDRTLTYNDLYKLDLNIIDPVALIQNLSCEVEKEMGIYPNI